jgi:hypothetical protein
MDAARRQLLAFRFGPGTRFDGRLVGALERIESGGAMRILDALFVGREPETGEIVAVSMKAEGSAGMTGRLLSFRLDQSTRSSSTKRVLESETGGLVRSLAGTLDPGAAVAAILVEHAWAQTLGDSVERMGASETVNEFVAAGNISELSVHLDAIASD